MSSSLPVPVLQDSWWQGSGCPRPTLPCSLAQRVKNMCLQRREGPPQLRLPVVALITSSSALPVTQFTLNPGDFPGCRAPAWLTPAGEGHQWPGAQESECSESSREAPVLTQSCSWVEVAQETPPVNRWRRALHVLLPPLVKRYQTKCLGQT